MDEDRTRLLRLRLNGARQPDSLDLELAAAATCRGTPRFLGQVVNGGSMPRGTDRVFLVNPVRLSGAEQEGAAAVLAVDGSRTIPVVVIGSAVPAVGDLLPTLAIGGRWVAQAGGSALLPCSPCAIPKKNLTLSWTNNLIGPGSTTLVFTPPGQWNSPCVNQMLFQLSCAGGLVQLTVTYFLSGACPGGQSQSCVSPGHDPFAITLDSFSCAGAPAFLLHYTVKSSGCPVLWSDGYTAFTITE